MQDPFASLVLHTPNKSDLHILHINSVINNLPCYGAKSMMETAWKAHFLHLTIFVVKQVIRKVWLPKWQNVTLTFVLEMKRDWL